MCTEVHGENMSMTGMGLPRHETADFGRKAKAPGRCPGTQHLHAICNTPFVAPTAAPPLTVSSANAGLAIFLWCAWFGSVLA